jgi:hypothetical protein
MASKLRLQIMYIGDICLRSPHESKTFIVQWDEIFYVLSIYYHYFFFYYWWGGTKSLGTAATSGLLYKPQMIDDDDCGP